MSRSAKPKSGAKGRPKKSPPSSAAASAKGRKAIHKAARRKKRGSRVKSVRFDYDGHGAHAAFVDVLDESTRAASDLIAAAIQQSWDELDDE